MRSFHLDLYFSITVSTYYIASLFYGIRYAQLKNKADCWKPFSYFFVLFILFFCKCSIKECHTNVNLCYAQISTKMKVSRMYA